MTYVRPKKHLGQHFLEDLNIAEKIARCLRQDVDYQKVLEIGPGAGVMTQFLTNQAFELWLIDVDGESVDYLNAHFGSLNGRVIHGDFLKHDLQSLFQEPYAVIGNFPYNISSQIFFRILEERNRIPEVVCMIQKEVAERLASPSGNKQYGILSVLLQAWYDIEYLFTVPPNVFNPPPKVNSGVIRLRRNEVKELGCDEVLFQRVVKAGFQMRRKKLRNALKPINLPTDLLSNPIFDKRAESLSVEQFIDLTNRITSCQKIE